MDRYKNTKPVVVKLVGFLIWGALAISRISFAQETSVFAGTAPALPTSTAMLTLNDDPQNKMIFHWKSSDSILGVIDTGEVTATTWNFFPGNNSKNSFRPARLVFIGGGGAQFRGNVLFENYDRAVVDVVRGSRRVRYLLRGGRIDFDGVLGLNSAASVTSNGSVDLPNVAGTETVGFGFDERRRTFAGGRVQAVLSTCSSDVFGPIDDDNQSQVNLQLPLEVAPIIEYEFLNDALAEVSPMSHTGSQEINIGGKMAGNTRMQARLSENGAIIATLGVRV